jgi:hypothetical protein
MTALSLSSSIVYCDGVRRYSMMKLGSARNRSEPLGVFLAASLNV